VRSSRSIHEARVGDAELTHVPAADRGNPGWFAATWEQVVEEQPDDDGRILAQVTWSWYIREQGGERSVEQGKKALVTTFEEYDVFPPPAHLAVDDQLLVSICASS